MSYSPYCPRKFMGMGPLFGTILGTVLNYTRGLYVQDSGLLNKADMNYNLNFWYPPIKTPQ